jgi:hypothetical protein
MGSPNGGMLHCFLSNALSLLKVQLECSTSYPLPRLNLIPISEEINPLQRKVCVFSADWENGRGELGRLEALFNLLT